MTQISDEFKKINDGMFSQKASLVFSEIRIKTFCFGFLLELMRDF